jgi:hypothetical protein
MNPLCLILGHHRSRGRAVEDVDFGWRSVCERCGAAMVRLPNRKWRLEKNAPRRPEGVRAED